MFGIFKSIATPSELSLCEDHDLVLRAQQQDQAAFTELVRRNHRQIFNVLYALLADQDEADDLTQEVFLKAYRALPNFEGRSKFYTWLYRLSINCWKDWLKSPRCRKEYWEDWHEETLQVDQPPVWVAADADVENLELQNLLKQALNDLPADYRATVVLREFEGLDYEEIAVALNCSVGTVKSRLFRARMRLRKLWETHYRHVWEGSY